MVGIAKKVKCAVLGIALVGVLGFSAGAHADTENYPDRTIHVVVPYPAGGNTDIIAREVTRRMSEKLGQSIVVENKPGANSIIGTKYVADAKPDGYTLGMVIGAYANNFSLYEDLPFTRDDLLPISQLTQTSLVLVTSHKDVKTIDDIVAMGDDPDKPVTYASSGVGSAAHLLGERLKRVANIEAAEHVPYKGSAEAVSDLVGGRVDFMFDAISAMGSHIRADRLQAVAVTGDSRAASLPDTPSMVEHGYPKMVAHAWGGLLAPKGTSPEIIDKLAKVAADVLHNDEELAEKLASISTEPVGSTPEAFDEFLSEEIRSNGAIIESLNITQD